MKMVKVKSPNGHIFPVNEETAERICKMGYEQVEEEKPAKIDKRKKEEG